MPALPDNTLAALMVTKDGGSTGFFGRMVAYIAGGVSSVPISGVIGRLKTVPPDGSLARTARALGISLGD